LAIERERKELHDEFDRLKMDRARLENPLLKAEEDLKKADEEFALVGRKLWEERQA
jgi:hypothetical protein